MKNNQSKKGITLRYNPRDGVKKSKSKYPQYIQYGNCLSKIISKKEAVSLEVKSSGEVVSCVGDKMGVTYDTVRTTKKVTPEQVKEIPASVFNSAFQRWVNKINQD